MAHARTRGVPLLQLSYIPAEGGPERFYARLGLRHTHRLQEGGLVLELPLAKRSIPIAHR